MKGICVNRVRTLSFALSAYPFRSKCRIAAARSRPRSPRGPTSSSRTARRTNKGLWAFIHLPYCEACIPGQRVYRCMACYKKFQSALQKRLPELERHQKAKVVRGPELVLDGHAAQSRPTSGGWLLALATASAEGHATLELVEAGAEGGHHLYRWRGNFPCCYDFKVPAVRAAIPANFVALEPRVSERVITVMSSVVDDTTGFVRADKEERRLCAL